MGSRNAWIGFMMDGMQADDAALNSVIEKSARDILCNMIEMLMSMEEVEA